MRNIPCLSRFLFSIYVFSRCRASFSTVIQQWLTQPLHSFRRGVCCVSFIFKFQDPARIDNPVVYHLRSLSKRVSETLTIS
ncbi:hypothetical protein OIU84_021651 [Salix udensis]|uniref:Secreted protein n=1 Tax=Salix udensis TaxID=889485 RepID=A0AAD6PHP4_9ROSI|nr:hypothetical protein OIU84_021651 [Salix udensis]